jgi:hypothetical protein
MGRRSAFALTLLVWVAGLAAEPVRAATAVESRVAASADDAEENAAGSVSIVGSDLELGWDGSAQTLGLRFPGLDVPQGAFVTDAWIQFETDEATASAVSLSFRAQAADDAPSFSTADEDLTSRARAAASAAWVPPAWSTVGEAGPDQRTPDLSALVQAVVDRPGWSAGNALVIFVNGDSGSGRRIARSWNSDPGGAPLLHVEYELSDVNDPPSLAIVSPIALTQLAADVPAALVATASDPEQGDLGASVEWTSSRDGLLGQGASLSPVLSVGIHTLTAAVQDLEGLAASASLDVEVTAGGYTLLTAGDIANCNSPGDEATADLLDQRFGSVLTLGDNAYPDGTLAEFQSCYHPSWGRHKARTRPATGNHEYHVDGAAGHFAYYGAAAGDPATGWYSFDLGGWHIVVLNSNCSAIGGCTRSSPQGLWLEAELAANPRACSIAVTHHPRFSSGSSHGSISAMRDLYDIFHDHGGDLFLSGHDHNYERFAPQDALGVADPTAPRQFVVGTGGASLRDMGEIQPNSVTSAGNVYGLLELTLHEGSYEWEFVPAAGYSYTDAGSAPCSGTDEEPVNQAPQVSIQAPADGASFPSGTPIEFSGSASDFEDGPLDAAISWTSSRHGAIGAGASFTTSALSVGTHTIQARVTDSDGVPSVAETSIEVSQVSAVTIEKRIAASSDDAEETNGGSHEVFLSSLDLELIDDGSDQLVGLRFPALEIPRGVRLREAWLQFQADGSTSSATLLQIRAQASDDAPTFGRTRGDLSDRPLGSASVSWSPPAWTGGAQGEAQRSPSLVSVVQEVVDREGWAPGNDLVLIITGSVLRRAESYEGIVAAAPLLHVEYEIEGGGGEDGGNETVGCGIGPELAGALPLLAWLHRRRRAPARRG